MKEAQEAVEETLTEYRQFLEKLSDKQRQDVIASLGLRMEELKAQRAAMEEEIKHDDWKISNFAIITPLLCQMLWNVIRTI